MKVSKRAIELIKRHEGIRLNAYLCPAKIWTIGYGSIVHDRLPGKPRVKQGDKITAHEAELELRYDLETFERIISTVIKVPINQNQFDALVSYWFNTGGSNTLVRLINSNAGKAAIYKWITTRYITGGGRVLNGLVKRRKEEADLYFKQ